MEAHSLHCPMCGAAAPPDAPACAYCRATLATVACPACFGRVFVGSRHCAHCGARAERPAAGAASAPRRCPRGCDALADVSVGGVALGLCAGCAGVWVDTAAFDRLCADRERQAAVIGAELRAPTGSRTPGSGLVAVTRSRESIRYVPCPACAALMNRVNFARVSGVIVDVCKPHGVWFDCDELRRVMAFVQRGGLDIARARERAALTEERRRLELRRAGGAFAPPRGADEVREASASGVLTSLLALLVS